MFAHVISFVFFVCIAVAELQLPYRTVLSSNIAIEEFLGFRGRTRDDSQWVNMSFVAGNDQAGDDLPLFCSARFQDKSLVCSNRKGGKFQSEKKTKVSIKAGDQFDIRFRPYPKSVRIFVNRKDTGLDYKYEQALTKVSSIHVAGDVQLDALNRSRPCCSLPYTTKIPGGLTTGKRVHITGFPKSGAKYFQIELMDGSASSPNKETALYISVRYKDKIIIRNNIVGGKWGKDERSGGLPIKYDELFDFSFTCRSNQFQIDINGVKFATYQSRIECTRATRLDVSGDIELFAAVVKGPFDE